MPYSTYVPYHMFWFFVPPWPPHPLMRGIILQQNDQNGYPNFPGPLHDKETCPWQCESSFEVWTTHSEGCEGCMWCSWWNSSQVQLGPSVKPAIESGIEEDQCRARASGQEGQMTSHCVKRHHINNLTQNLLVEDLVSIKACHWSKLFDWGLVTTDVQKIHWPTSML